MGYTTEFAGKFLFDRPLTAEHLAVLKQFIELIWDRKVTEAMALAKPGIQAPENGYCQWAPTKNGDALEWDGNEKFYQYTEWLEFLLAAFLSPWGYIVNGDVTWQGEEVGDVGVLSVKNNVVTEKKANLAALGEAQEGWQCCGCGFFFRAQEVPVGCCVLCCKRNWQPVTATFQARTP